MQSLRLNHTLIASNRVLFTLNLQRQLIAAQLLNRFLSISTHPVIDELQYQSLLSFWTLQRYKVYYEMGNKDSKTGKLPTFKPENWHKLSTIKFARPQYGLYYLYANNLTNERVEEYQIYFHNEAEYQKYLEFFQWRQREDSIVNTKFINSEEIKQFCNTNHNARIYIEHIPVRLSHIEDIPYPENLYVLFSTLDGFEKIFFWVGYFQPTEHMVCVDCDGKVKVWFNSDLSKCHTEQSQFADQTSNFHAVPHFEQQMVAEIIEMIEQNTSDQIQASMTFSQYLWHIYKGKKINFKQAKLEVINYAKKNHTQIPNYFESVLSLFNDQGQSELEDASVVQPNSHRANKEVPRKLLNNTNNHQPTATQNTQNQHWYQNNENIPQQSVIVNSIGHQPPHRTSSEERARTSTEHLPYFSMVNQPIHHLQLSRPTSPAQTRQPTHITNTASNLGFQVKFNYQPAVPQEGLVIRPIINQRQIPEPVQFAAAYRPQPYIPPAPPVPIVVTPSQNTQQRKEKSDRQNKQQISRPQEDIKNRTIPNKLVYSDTTVTYELDDQIAQDIMKYFGPEHA